MILLAAIVTTPVMITEDAFARYQRHTGYISQAASVRNSCLNPTSDSNTNSNMVSNGNCGGTVSQQGQSGNESTATTVQNANPAIEVQRSTTAAQPPLTSTGGNCTACFANLTAAQKSYFEGLLQSNSMGDFGIQINTIEQLCTFLENIVPNGSPNGGDPIPTITTVQSLLNDVPGLSSRTINNIGFCLLRAVE